MPASLADWLPIITGALFGLALLLVLFSLRLFRRSRTDVFWRKRRQAGQRGWRVFVLAIFLFAASGMLCALTSLTWWLDRRDADDTPSTSVLQADAFSATPTLAPSDTPTNEPPAASVNPEPTDGEVAPTDTLAPTELATFTATGASNTAFDTAPENTSTPAPTQVNLPSPTPPNTVVVVVTATPGITPSPTVFPTFTPIVTPVHSNVTPFPYARLQITALDDAISDDLEPINPRQEFDAGTTRLYLFVDYRSMTEGVLWRREVLRDDEIIEENTYLWGLEANGSGYFFFGEGNGFVPGDYEVRVYIGTATEPASAMTFTITE